uniref:Solute carrier family 35 member F2 n=1 Tax=Neolamprologus brichardi TaxID=32507 RepID=A0A3Q4HBT4_NEOBR
MGGEPPVDNYVQHRPDRLCHRSTAHLSLRQLAKTLAMGQGLAGLICGTAITSQFLASNFHVNTPMLQSFLNYLLLTVTYTTMLLCRTGDGNFLQILKRRWWKYLLLGLVDVEANYTVVKAYQYTTITSIQVSRLSKFISVVCLMMLNLSDDLVVLSSASNILLGDGLVLLSASLYAVSNVCQEYTVKNLSRVEFLGMVGLFGTIISTIQMTQWTLWLIWCFCFYSYSGFMPIVIKLSSATSVNLSLLTADLFGLFCGIFLFHYNFSGLYIVSLVVILIGFVAFNAVPTPTAATDSSPSSSPAATCEEGCSENPVDAQELQPTEDRRKRSTSGPEQSYGSTELGTRM